MYRTHRLVMEAIFTQCKERIRAFSLTWPCTEKTLNSFLSCSLSPPPPAAVSHAAAPPPGVRYIYIILFHRCHHPSLQTKITVGTEHFALRDVNLNTPYFHLLRGGSAQGSSSVSCFIYSASHVRCRGVCVCGGGSHDLKKLQK